MAAQNSSCDILIRNGKIIDGTGNSWYYGDIAVKDGKILKTNLNTQNSEEINISSKAGIKSMLCPSQMDGLLFISSGTCLIVFDLISNSELCCHDFSDEIQTSFWLKEEESIAFGFKSGAVRIFNVNSKSVTCEHKEHTEKVKSITKIKLGENIVVCSSGKDKKLKFFSLKTKAVVKTLNVVNKTRDCARGVMYGHDEKSLLTIHQDGKFIVNNYNSGNESTEQSNKVFKIQSGEVITCGAYYGDSVSFVIGSKSGNMDIFTAK